VAVIQAVAGQLRGSCSAVARQLPGLATVAVAHAVAKQLSRQLFGQLPWPATVAVAHAVAKQLPGQLLDSCKAVTWAGNRGSYLSRYPAVV